MASKEFWTRNQGRDVARSGARLDPSRGGREEGGSRATRAHDYYGDEGRYRGAQRVSPGGEYLNDRSQAPRTESYTDQGFGENRGRSDWRTEDRIFDTDFDSPYAGNEDSHRAARAIAEAGGYDYARGTHRGRGPRNYRRSDERIREDVCEALTEDPSIDASNLEVSVKDGEVTLSGSVDSRTEKRSAEYVVDTIRGVKDVHNRLRLAAVERGVEKGEPH
jgi:osmotically-inducible protein OsmY